MKRAKKFRSFRTYFSFLGQQPAEMFIPEIFVLSRIDPFSLPQSRLSPLAGWACVQETDKKLNRATCSSCPGLGSGDENGIDPIHVRENGDNLKSKGKERNVFVS